MRDPAIRLADTLMTRYPHPDNYPYLSWTYSQGFVLMGFVYLYERTGDAKYREYVLKYADFHVSPEGHIYRFQGESLDSMMPGALLCWAYRETGEERYRKACEGMYEAIMQFPRNSHGGYWHAKWAKEEMWVDGVFMGGMFLTRCAAYIGHAEECYAELCKQLDVIFELCHKSGGLLFHGWSEGKDTPWANRLTGRSTDVWSEGLGWYTMILAEAARLLPEDHPQKPHVRERFAQLLTTLSAMQDKQTGLFYQVVDKGDDPNNWHDTSGSAMFLYAFSVAQKLGLGDYADVLTIGLKGILSKTRVNENGLVDVFDACDGLGVQNNYDAYLTFPKSVNAKEAVGAVLWFLATVE